MKSESVKLPIEKRDAAKDRISVENRINAFYEAEPASGKTPLLKAPIRHFETCCGIPEIDAAALSAEALAAAISSTGSIIVRNLLDSRHCSSYRDIIDNVMDKPKSDHHSSSEVYDNPPGNLTRFMRKKQLSMARVFRSQVGAEWCIESASVAEQLFELYEELGLKEILAKYLQEQPCLSAKKWVLRRSLLSTGEVGWHQDGGFMGSDIKSLNMWITLSECGGDTGAPGIDIFPCKLDSIIGDEGRTAVEQSLELGSIVEEMSNNTPPVSPVFQAGDAIFFDHFNLHRTQYNPSIDKIRYAIETWFFGSKSFAKNQIPMAW